MAHTNGREESGEGVWWWKRIRKSRVDEGDCWSVRRSGWIDCGGREYGRRTERIKVEVWVGDVAINFSVARTVAR